MPLVGLSNLGTVAQDLNLSTPQPLALNQVTTLLDMLKLIVQIPSLNLKTDPDKLPS
jgi:hypothetical protein